MYATDNTLATKWFNNSKSMNYWEWEYELFNSKDVLDIIYKKESTVYVFIDNSKLSIDLLTSELFVF